MTTSEVTQEAVFIGANKQNYVSDYNPNNNVIAFGAANTVALWKPLDSNQNGVYYTLKEHSQEVTGVKFLPNSPYLISIGEDHVVNVWKQNGSIYEHSQSLIEHSHSVTCIAVINEKVFVTGGADHQIIIWVYDDSTNEFKLGEKFQVKANFYPLALAIQDIEKDNYLIAIGGTTNNIYIYNFELKESQVLSLSKSAELTGHEDWIKCLQFVTEETHKNYILASGAQDRYVRLWRLKLNELIDDSDEDPTKLVLLSNKQYKFDLASGSRAAFSFEALIMGHDDWISGIQWHPSCKDPLAKDRKFQLLTCTADTALMIWEMDSDSGIWVCVSRLGEMSVKGASTATGASGGFWSCLWFIDPSTQEHYVLASGKTGSFRVYKSDTDGKSFASALGITGAVRDITDIKWSVDGDYFIATSLDQTTRLYAPWKKHNSESWHEFARPQIHGYDMICYDNITPTKFVSGGDEKILRVFEMTKSISKLLEGLCGIKVLDEESELPVTASLPVLGLSNKAENQIEQGDQQDEDEEKTPEAADDVLASLEQPPVEEHLQRYTLFPELEKLYGHGYEISCCSTSPNGKLIATACKSNTAKHAVIRIFNVSKDYQQSPQVLLGHNLTISSLEFSPDGQYLLAVSRDRQFSLWEVVDEDTAEFKLVELNPKAHSRILWDCSWLPVNNLFTTVSRDKQIKLWKVADDKVQLVSSTKLSEPITSVSVYKGGLINNHAVVAVGLEDGGIEIFTVNLANPEFKHVSSFEKEITPSGRIEKLSFSNKLDNKNRFLLGVGSKDTSARLYSIDQTLFV
ncbi:Elongator complex protein 2 [Candida viswanathii]|uniref:Elongator complex protein 2 n=1 Tax=Candida viswanathii TaxID=5486 RepID=A0A367YBD9_9ASCO|nr:Elongator complex protein 2 [Candida viswanathii]